MDVRLAADCVVRRTLQRVERLGVATRVAQNFRPAAATLRSFAKTRAGVQRLDGATERAVGLGDVSLEREAFGERPPRAPCSASYVSPSVSIASRARATAVSPSPACAATFACSTRSCARSVASGAEPSSASALSRCGTASSLLPSRPMIQAQSRCARAEVVRVLGCLEERDGAARVVECADRVTVDLGEPGRSPVEANSRIGICCRSRSCRALRAGPSRRV